MKDLNITVENGVKTVELRSGKANDIPQPREIEIKGQIDTPLRYLQNPCPRFEVEKSSITISREQLIITLKVGQDIRPTDTYTGQLEESQDLKDFGINSGKSYTTFELAEKIKMNRLLFKTKDEAMRLVAELRNFKAKVDKDIELADDGRGNNTIKRIQAVESNIPESFTMEMQVFKGMPKTSFNVEVSIDAQDMSCTLISPDLADHIRDVSDGIIDEQVDEIKKLFPNIRIFEV